MKRIEDLKFQIESGCRFCNPPEKERILMETDNFYVMVSLGPIVEGYLLIVAKKHMIERITGAAARVFIE